jgi:hypothetical protein
MRKVKESASYLASLAVRIDDALRAARLAQDDLAAVVNGLVVVGDKRMITPALELPFAKVRTAEGRVCDLQQLLAARV